MPNESQRQPLKPGVSPGDHSHEHGAQLEEVVVLGVLHLHHAPGVQPTPHLLPLGLDLLVGPHHRERDAGLEGGDVKGPPVSAGGVASNGQV